MTPPGWLEVPAPAIDPGMLVCKAFFKDRLRVIFTTEEHGTKIVRHVSVSHASRYPTWEEIKDVRRDFFGTKHEAIMFLPPDNEYVNLHENCFHLWAKANGERWQ